MTKAAGTLPEKNSDNTSGNPPDKTISGLGPHGERAVPPSQIELLPEDIAEAREKRFSVAIVFHTTTSDWARQQISGIVGTLGACSTIVSEVVDCGFQAEAQISALERLSKGSCDAIISIPVANAPVVDAHRLVSRAGKQLILNDNVPTGMVPGKDYTSLVSADNFGLGLIGAELLSPEVEEGGEIGVMTYGVDFFATNEREIAFNRWMKSHRPDLKVRTIRFPSLNAVRKISIDLIETCPDLSGLFIVWDTPAMEVVNAFEASGITIPITTVDLGRKVSIELAKGKLIRGIAAQQPFEQGVAAAQATILSLLKKPVPRWVALPGVSVTRDNVVESYQRIWSSPAPAEILKSLGKS